jgi:DNA-binding transcriptional regulator YhcF (GntR family)
LEVRPGIGTVVAERKEVGKEERSRAVRAQLEQLAVDARRLGFSLRELQEELGVEWRRVDSDEEGRG